MLEALEISATGMRAHELQINTISHNVANISTNGFRRQIVSFAEVSGETDLLTNALTATVGANAGSLATVGLSLQPGELKQTNAALDLAIDGTGFLEVTRPDGSLAYTRTGNLRLNDAGQLVLASGELLSAGITLPADATQVEITTDGGVLVTNSQGVKEEAGQIELVSFTNPAALMPAGNNLYVATPQVGELRVMNPGESGMGVLRQGYLETSNVQMIDEMVGLMIAQRGFEMNSRVAQAADQMQALTNGLLK